MEHVEKRLAALITKLKEKQGELRKNPELYRKGYLMESINELNYELKEMEMFIKISMKEKLHRDETRNRFHEALNKIEFKIENLRYR